MTKIEKIKISKFDKSDFSRVIDTDFSLIKKLRSKLANNSVSARNLSVKERENLTEKYGKIIFRNPTNKLKKQNYKITQSYSKCSNN